MYFPWDPDEWKTEIHQVRCPYHERNPGDHGFAGCTCATGMSQVRRAPEEVAEIKRTKRLAHEEEILREADAIRAQRAVS